MAHSIESREPTGIDNVNVEPTPGVLCIVMSPPRRLAMRLQIARPRPVPRRAVRLAGANAVERLEQLLHLGLRHANPHVAHRELHDRASAGFLRWPGLKV